METGAIRTGMPPYPPPDPNAAPPMPGGGMRDQMMPPPGGAPRGQATPGDVMAADAERQQAQMAGLAEQAPMPTGGGYPVDVLDGLVESINTFIDEANKIIASEADADLSPEDVALPPLQWQAPEGTKSWDQKVPAPIFLHLVAIAAMTQTVGDGKFKSLTFDPMELTTSGAGRKIAARVEKIAKNKEFMRAVASAATGGVGAGPPPPSPEPKAVEVPEGMAGQRDAMSAAAM